MGYSLENICGSTLVDLHCQLTRSYFMGKDSRLSEKLQKFSALNILPYTVPHVKAYMSAVNLHNLS